MCTLVVKTDGMAEERQERDLIQATWVAGHPIFELAVPHSLTDRWLAAVVVVVEKQLVQPNPVVEADTQVVLVALVEIHKRAAMERRRVVAL